MVSLRFLFVAFIVIVSWCAEAQQSGAASVAGVVVNAANGKPLPRVHVRLTPSDSESSLIYGAVTTPEGRFSIAKIKPGAYSITLERPGFVGTSRPDSDSNSVKVAEGDEVQLNLTMTPRTVFSGHVVDEYGEPMMYVSVNAQPIGHEPVKESLYSLTNDRGEFRISAPPGKYRLMAEILDVLAFSDALGTHTDGRESFRYRKTFFPSAMRKSASTAIEGKSGSEVGGLEIRMARSLVLSISGRVLRVPDGSDLVAVTAAPGYSPTNSLFGTPARVLPDGRFSLEGLQPGRYRIWAKSWSGDESLYSPVQEVVLTDTNVDGVDLVLGPGIQLQGVMVAVGRGRRPSDKQTAIVLWGDNSQRSNVNADGTFQFKDVGPGRYLVLVRELPENSYIQSIELNGSKSANIITLGQEGTAALKIKISANGGRLSGKVAAASGRAGSDSRVWLVPETQNVLPEDVRFSEISAEQTYSFQGLPSGTYRLGLGDAMTSQSEADEREEFIDDFIHDPATVVVTVREGETVVRDLKTETSKSDR